MAVHRITIPLVGVIFLVCLGTPVPALTQTKEEPRLGIGVTLIPSSYAFGIGVGGGVLLPFTDITAGSLGVLIAGGFQHGSRRTIDEIGGGLCLTHPLNAKRRVFFQGTISLAHEFSRTRPVYTGGGGVSITVTEHANFLAEGDIGVRDGRGVGLMFFGISVPISKR
jgi:hypothetical protein